MVHIEIATTHVYTKTIKLIGGANMEYKCPSRESSKYLCDRVSEYQIDGTLWCNIHARRIIEFKGVSGWWDNIRDTRTRVGPN